MGVKKNSYYVQMRSARMRSATTPLSSVVSSIQIKSPKASNMKHREFWKRDRTFSLLLAILLTTQAHYGSSFLSIDNRSISKCWFRPGRQGQLLRMNGVPASSVKDGGSKQKLAFDSRPAARGLTKDEVQQKLEQNGKNELDPPKHQTWQELWIAQFDDRLVQILLAVATISSVSSFTEAMDSSDDESILHFFVEPFIILLILMINAAVGVSQQLSAINSLDALKKLQPKLATVLRQDDDGKDEWIPTFDSAQLVPGDVIKVKVGDSVPADAYVTDLLSSAVLSVDESSLTGESASVSKEPLDDMGGYDSGPVAEQVGTLFAGTMITKGKAEALVSKTGSTTEIGKIQRGVMTAEIIKTPLNVKLDKFGDDLALLIAGICAAVWLISIPRFDDPSFESVFEGALYYTKVAVSLGVAAIPEGLPAVITLVLALGTRRLAEQNVIGEYCSFIH